MTESDVLQILQVPSTALIVLVISLITPFLMRQLFRPTQKEIKSGRAAAA